MRVLRREACVAPMSRARRDAVDDVARHAQRSDDVSSEVLMSKRGVTVRWRSWRCWRCCAARAARGQPRRRAAPEEVAPGLKVGDMLDQSNAQLAKDLLPPEILKHYENGDYRNQIVAYPTGNAHWEKSFLEATEKNAGATRRRRARHDHREGHRQAARRTSTASRSRSSIPRIRRPPSRSCGISSSPTGTAAAATTGRWWRC